MLWLGEFGYHKKRSPAYILLIDAHFSDSYSIKRIGISTAAPVLNTRIIYLLDPVLFSHTSFAAALAIFHQVNIVSWVIYQSTYI